MSHFRAAIIGPEGPPIFAELDCDNIRALLQHMPIFILQFGSGVAHVAGKYDQDKPPKENHTATRLLTLQGVQCTGPMRGLAVVTGPVDPRGITSIPPELERWINRYTREG